MLKVSNISGFSFFLIFPGFFYYSWMVGSGLIPPLSLGYYKVVIILVFSLFLTRSVFYGGGVIFSHGRLGLIFILLQAYMAVVAFVNYLLGVGDNYSGLLFSWVVAGCLLNIALYYVGRSLDLNKSKWYFFILIGFLVVIILNLGEDNMFYLKRDAVDDVQDDIATYQGFGRSLMVFGLASVIFSKKFFSVLCFFLSLLMLFLNGARTEMFLFVLGVLSYAFFVMGFFRGIVISLGVVFVVVCLGYFYYAFNPASRMFEFILADQSSSGSMRLEMLLFSLNAVFSDFKNMIFGDFGSYVYFGGVGAYPHNLFSAWHNFGIIVFFLYVWLLSYVWRLFSHFKSKKPLLAFGFSILTVTTVAFMVSKDNSYMLFGLLIGIASNRKLIQQNEFTRQ